MISLLLILLSILVIILLCSKYRSKNLSLYVMLDIQNCKMDNWKKMLFINLNKPTLITVA